MSTYKIYGLILSAGLSGRMGKFKPLLNYKGKTFIQNIVLKLSSVCDKVIVVTGYKAGLIETNVNQLTYNTPVEFVHNENYEKGMFTSLQAGLIKAAGSDWIIYHFVDQPGLPESFYAELVKQIDDKHNWIQPEMNKRRGHPVLIDKSLFDLITGSPAESNLRDVSNNPLVKKKFYRCSYKEIFQDVDTDGDYTALIKNAHPDE